MQNPRQRKQFKDRLPDGMDVPEAIATIGLMILFALLAVMLAVLYL